MAVLRQKGQKTGGKKWVSFSFLFSFSLFLLKSGLAYIPLS